MKVTKIKIDSLYGVHHLELNGNPVEITGKKGTGKTSVIDSIKYALSNRSERPYIVNDGANEGEIYVQTDTGLEIQRKKRPETNDYLSVKDGGKSVSSAQTFLNDIFTPLQLNPVEFASWSDKEQNRAILSLIDFKWDMEWIREQFGEIPSGIDYSQHILSVLEDIQSKNGDYWKRREDVNREEYYKRQTIQDMAVKFPQGYDVNKWADYDIRSKSAQLQKAQEHNSLISRAKAFYDAYDNKVRGITAEKDIAINAEQSAINTERVSLNKTIERLKGEIKAAETALLNLDSKLSDKIAVIEAECREKIAKLDGDIKVSEQYKDKQPIDITPIRSELDEAIQNKEFVSEYRSMLEMKERREELIKISEDLTEKINKARELPGIVLASSTLPIDGLSVVDGKPLINGRPIANLSSGEKIDLCVDITIAQSGKLDLILIDGAEALDDESRAELYKRCLDKGIQVIATRTTNENELIVTELED
jgi:energy-coupling factor transporter ATP-binding protein EcfA2